MSIDPGSIRFIEGRREVMFFIADIVGMNAVVGDRKWIYARHTDENSGIFAAGAQ